MFKASNEPLTSDEIEQLEELSQIKRYHLRSKIILLGNLSYSSQEIARILHCNIWTVWKWRRYWRNSKLQGLNIKLTPSNQTPEVLRWRQQVLDTVNTPPRQLKLAFATWSVKRLWHYLRKLGCPFGHNRIRKIMKQGGLRYRSTKTRPYTVHPDYAERKAKVEQAYLDTDEDHLVLVLDQKIFLSDVGVKGKQWSVSIPSIPSHQWHNGKALMLGVYDVKRDHIHHGWLEDLKAKSIRATFARIFRELPAFKKCSIIMDNYQGNRAKIFQKALTRRNIDVIWLPAWSPHLSLIEAKFSIIKAEAVISMILSSVRSLKMHVTRFIKYYNSERKELYDKPKYALI